MHPHKAKQSLIRHCGFIGTVNDRAAQKNLIYSRTTRVAGLFSLDAADFYNLLPDSRGVR